MAIIFAIQGFTQQGEITIGNGTSTTSYVPMHCNYDYSYSQTIYTSSEIIGGTISQIAYYMTSSTSRTEVIDIYAGNTTKNSFSSTTDYVPLSSLTQVYSGSCTFVQGWNYITLTTPFIYNGTDNLVIAVDKNTGGYSSRTWQSHTASFTSCMYFYQDNTNIDPNSPTTTSSYNRGTNNARPNTKFVITPSAPGFCWAPNNLQYSNLTSDGAKISWISDINISSYTISLKTIDQTWEQATLIATLSDTSYILTNLLPDISYDVKVTPVCTTPLSSIVSFTTPCATLSVPTITEEFNSVPPSRCWERKSGLLPASGPATLTTTTSGWSLNSYVTPSNATMNIYSSNKYWLISPSIDLGNGTTPMQLEFDVFYTDWGNANPVESLGDDDRFAVVISTDNGVTWEAANAFIWSSDINSSRILGNITNTPSHVIIPLYNQSNSLPYTGTIKIGFYGESTVSNTDNDLHIDNFVINPFESCRKPSNINLSSLTSTSANISFQENGTATTWQYALTTNGNDPNNITPISVTTNPILLTNLTPNTQYKIWVRSDCSTETSNWSNQLSFTTDALPATIPFLSNFENQLENSAWRNLSGSVNNWAIGQAAGNGPTTQNTSDNTSAYISNDEGLSYAMTDGYIYAYGYRDIDFGTTPASYSLNFDWKCQGYVSGTSTYSGLIVFLRNVTDTLNPTGNPSNVNDNLALLSQSENWQNKEITIDNVSGVKRLIFYYFDQNDNYAPPAAIDNISVEILPCPRPFDVTINSLSSTLAQIGWSSNVGNSWYLYYKSTFDPFYDSILVNTNTYTLQNLTPQATYTYYLRTKCGTELSAPTNIYTFTTPPTPCESVTVFPWIEGFESDWTAISAQGNKPSSNCWTVIDKGGTNGTYEYWWKKGTSSSHSGTGHAVCYTDYGTTSHNDWLISPQFALTGNQKLSFWAMRYSASTSEPDEVSVFISNPNTIINSSAMGTYDTLQGFTRIFNQLLPSGDWQQYEIDLSLYSGNRYIAFVRQGTPDGWYLRIDDILIDNIPTCLKPTALLASNPTSTGFDLNWTDESGSLYNIQYMPSTQTDWANATTIPGVTKPYTFNTLNHSTSYKVRVQTDCSTEQSEWSAPITFTTSCGTITELPWTEGFDTYGTGTTIYPLCWSRLYNATSANPYINSTNFSSPGSMYFTAASGKYSYAITPQFDASIPISSLSAKFQLRTGNGTSKIIVGVLTNPADSLTFVAIDTLKPTYSSTWQEFEVNFANYSGNGQYIAFKSIYNTTTNTCYIDNLSVYTTPTCLKPTALTTSNPTTTGFDLGWADASGSLYNIQYMPSSQTDWANATTISGVTAHSYTFNSLNSGTIYKVRVQTDCVTKQSEWSAIITDTTLCATITTLPYTESFDNYGVGSNTNYPLCWSRLYNTTTASPYISSTYSVSSPGSMYFTAPTGKNSFAITPQFDASIQISSLSARFQLRSGNATSNIIVGVLTNPADSLSFTAIDTLKPTASSTWQEFEVDFANYSGNGQYIAFKSEYNTATNTCYIDDLTVYTTPSCERPSAISATSTSNSIVVNVTPAETTDNGWKVYYRVANSANWDSINITSNIATIPNLQPQTVYEIYAKTLCSDATYSFSNSSIFVETKQIPVLTSYASNFEAQGDNGWILRNGTSVNKWMIGTPVGARSNALFISNNNANATYATGSQSVVIAEKLFEINSPDSLELSFDALVGGESLSDYLKVFLVDKDTVFSPSLAATYFSDNSYSEGIIMPNGTNNYINLIPATHFKTRFVSPGIGVQKKLIFVWRNDGSVGTQPSCYIDNVAFLNIITPYPPTNLHATPSISNSQLTWTAGAAELGWQVRKGETGTPVYVTTPAYQASNLTPSTEYTYYIRSYYADDTLYSEWVPVSFRTLAIPQRVTTINATAITQTTVTLNGTIVPGTDPITNQGFEYRVLGNTEWIPLTATFDDTIAYNLTNLLPNTQYEFRAFASTNYVSVYGRAINFTTLPTPPTAITTPATAIAQTIATLNGSVAQGSLAITQKGFEWRLVGANTWTTVLLTSPVGAISYNLTGLTALTDYEYRTFVSTASENIYGTTQSFTTLAIVPPTVTTTSATAIAQTVANLNANVVLGSEIITEQGFEWRLVGQNTWTTVTSTLVAGTITNNLSGLVASNDYEYRAYATTESGTIYGLTQSFRTLDIVPPIVLTGNAIAVAQTIETLNGSITLGSESITDNGFEWRLLGETIWTPVSVVLNNNAMIYNLNGLTANTEYEFRAYATTESATTYGDVNTFRTLAMPPPIVITSNVSLLTQTSATLNGTALEVLAPITSQGFEWRALGETSWTIVNTTSNNGSIMYNLNNLTAYSNYEYRAYAITAEGVTYGDIQSFRTLPIMPVVNTNPATAIAQTIATLNGDVTIGSETISAYGFEWRLQGASSWTIVPLTDNTLVYNLTGIIASNNYEFRAFVTTESANTYGSIQSFRTLDIVPPVIVTNSATSIDPTNATLNGLLTLGSEEILAQGFEWKLVSATAWMRVELTPGNNILAHTFTDLVPNRAYEFKAYVTTESGTIYGATQTFTTPVIPQVVTTSSVTNITQTNATLNAIITSGSESLITQGFEWKLSSASTWTIITSPLINNAITHNLSGLAPYTSYEVRAFSTTASATIYGAVQSFTTEATPTIVVTDAATLIAQTTATLNATINLGSKPLTSQGFEWRLAGGNTWTNVAASLNGTVILNNLTGLTANTAYEYRAYAINASETIYGAVQSFTTLAIPPIVVTEVATLITQTTATLNGTITIGSESILTQGFEWKLSSASTWNSLSLNGNAIIHNLTGLNPNSDYQFRAYATTASGTVYGTTQNFTTLAVVPPTVVTTAATAISQNIATLNGTITEGSDAILVQGFEWKLSSASTWTAITTTINGNAITHNLLGLAPNTAYQYRAYATTSLGTVYGTTQNFTTLAIVPPTVVTTPATALAYTTATLNGTITLGSEVVLSQGFEWALSSSNTWNVTIDNLIANALTHNLTLLAPNTAYKFRAYATTASGTVYGTTQNFTTQSITPPTVVTNAATLVTENSSTLNGTITAGTETITSKGFEWKVASSNTWLSITISGSVLTHNLTSLTSNTAYQFRAYAITNTGTVYGTTQNFTTLAVVPPTVVTSPATAISQNTATLNGTVTVGSGAIIVQGFEWKLSSASTWTTITTTINGNAITHNLLGLTPNTAYQYRAYATTSLGTVYGTTQNFTTLAVVPPTVVTNAATLIAQNSATINGTVTLGSESIIFKGFEYKLANSSTWTPLVVNASGSTINYNLTGLTPNSAYQFRAYATTSAGIVYGTTQNFTTLAIVTPVVVTNAATSIAQTTAILNGTITVGSEAVITQGFEWTLSNSTTWNITTENLTANGITRNLTDLAPNTAYKYRAYAVTQSGTIYGSVQNFTTLAINAPTVVTNAASAITETTATLNGTITPATEPITSQGFEWRVANTNIWMPITITGNALTHNLTGLTPNTSYEFRAMATTPTLTVYGEIETFTTLEIVYPIVITNPVTPTSSTSVTLTGTITAGSEAILSQGFEWKQAGASQWSVIEATLTGNTITYNLTGLIPNTSYRFRAGAITASGVTYGSTETFTTLGLNDVQGNDVSVKMYPNPTNTQTKLVVNGISGDVKIVLSDARGRILRTINTEAIEGSLEQVIDVNDLAEGIYYIRIQNADINKTQKLIVK